MRMSRSVISVLGLLTWGCASPKIPSDVGATEDVEELEGSANDEVEAPPGYDGDGMADDLLVFTWTGSSAAFRETVTEAIEDLVNSIHFSSVALQVEGDEWGFVTHIEPPFYDNIEPAAGIDVLDFTLHFRGVVAATTEDQLYSLTLNVIGDETILLDTLDIIVVVPGTSY